VLEAGVRGKRGALTLTPEERGELDAWHATLLKAGTGV
jgi:hypothetical protein